MITFKKIRYRNFLSSGNQFTEIELDKNSSTLVIGKNGAGKCVSINTYVTLKNKKTGEIFKMTVGEFYDTQKK